MGKITENMKLKGILELVCEAEELKDWGYRIGEQKVIGQILLGAHEVAVNKVHGLLLMHMNRIPTSN